MQNWRIMAWILGISAIISLLGLSAVIWFWQPHSPAILALTTFYIVLTLFVSSSFGLVVLLLRQWWKPAWYQTNISISLRQGALCGIFVSSLLILQSQGLLFWWVGLIAGLTFIFLELAFISP